MKVAECWAPVHGFECAYEVSSLGRVRSIGRVTKSKAGWERSIRGRVLRLSEDKDGYLTVCLSFPSERVMKVHRLVLSAFLPAFGWPELQVNHIDGNKANNVLSNLEWCSQLQNMEHAKKVLGKSFGRIDYQMRDKSVCARGHQMTPDNTYVRDKATGAVCCAACSKEAARRYREKRKQHERV